MGGRSRLGPGGQECDEEQKESDPPEVNPTTAANAETQLLSFTISAPPISNLLKASLEVDGSQVEASSEEAAGVITGDIQSQGREEASTAGVITGGDEGFRLRLAHTRYPWLDDFMLLMSGHRRNGCETFLL
ncbi:hypothetical protein PF008_g29043 [Phytophthora fragariae]|uniref:Uncharacterized protein n=1 Tax=Phytophthora fragariae TaxID=53985 RepID=A0A6G0Q9N7_9STRA|nr:hypothetical protein PF008_g29043 [Phytophthora fragariae]